MLCLMYNTYLEARNERSKFFLDRATVRNQARDKYESRFAVSNMDWAKGGGGGGKGIS